MADGYVQVPPDSSGKLIDTEERVNYAGQTVERQRVAIPDGVLVDGDALARILIEQRIANLLLAEGLHVSENIEALRDELLNVVSLGDVAYLTVSDQLVSGGANVTAATLATGSQTIDCGKRPLQKITNNGAFTLTAPTVDGSCMVMVTNGASAGAVTFSGFTVGASTGDALDTTNAHVFTLSIWRISGVSGYRIAAHQ